MELRFELRVAGPFYSGLKVQRGGIGGGWQRQQDNRHYGTGSMLRGAQLWKVPRGKVVASICLGNGPFIF
jgi:hypothetical protein